MDRVLTVAVVLCLAVGLVAGAAMPSAATDDLDTSEYFWGGFGLRPRFGFGFGRPWGYGGFGGGFGYPGFGFGGYPGFGIGGYAGFGGYPGFGRFGYPGYWL